MAHRLRIERIFEYARRTEANRANSVHAPHHMSAGLVHPEAPAELHLTVNFVPASFRSAFADPYEEFGQCSQTIHAEVANIFSFPRTTRGGHMFLYPHCCPNCAKDIITSGIETVYIDHRAHQSHYKRVQATFSAGDKDPFDALTLPMLKAYGLNVFEVDPDAGKIIPLSAPKIHRRPLPGVQIFSDTQARGGLKNFMPEVAARFDSLADWSVARVSTARGKTRLVVATSVSPPGMEPIHIGKFSTIIDSLSLLLVTARRERWEIIDGMIGSNLPPYPRALVNAVAAGIGRFDLMGLRATDRQADRLEALQTLSQKGLIHVSVRSQATRSPQPPRDKTPALTL